MSFKNNKKLNVLLLIVIISISNLIIFTLNLYDNNTYSKELIQSNKVIKKSGNHAPIHIDGNWAAAYAAGICTGSGFLDDPFVIQDLTIDGGGSGSGILIENSDVYFIIEHCTIYNTGSQPGDAGIRLQNTDNGQLIDNDCSNNNIGGIAVIYSNYNTISGNTINFNVVSGIDMTFSSDNMISGNIVNNNYGWGMFIFDCDWITISGNTANNNAQCGILVESSLGDTTDYNIIIDNTINHNGWSGIYLARCMYSTISGNYLTGNNHDGMSLYMSNNNYISKNIIINNGGNIDFQYSNYNRVYLNNFINNIINLYYNSINIWNSPELITYTYGGKTYSNHLGNYWSDYQGSDNNGDGIGDTPYNIDGDNDNYPLMDPLIRVFRVATGVIEEINFQYYVKNVLPNEWAACWDWNIEALKAGAMAIKTYAWYRILHPKYPRQGYDVRDDEWDQVYDPDWKEKFVLATPEERYENAIEATWKAIMTKESIIFEAQYDSGTPGTPYPLITGRLSQWGTQYWAELGKDWQWIIHYYYDPVEILQFSVNTIELFSKWIHDPITSLPLYKSTIEYYILNLGSDVINDMELTIKFDGNILVHKIIPSITKGEAYIDRITLNIDYDSSKEIKIIVSKGLFKEIFTDTIYARIPRDLNTLKLLRTFGPLYVTPDDLVVQATLQEILNNNPPIEWIAIRDWVADNVEYAEDYGFFQLPRETIQWGIGDCEDYAILLTSLLRANGWSANDVWVVVGSNDKNEVHCWVRIEVGEVFYSINSVGGSFYTYFGDVLSLHGFKAGCMFNDLNYQDIDLSVFTKSPVDIIVMDPDGLTISKQVNEIPGAIYSEVDPDGDGDFEDQVAILDKKIGDYIITLIPEADASPTDTYTLEISVDGTTTVLAEDVQISDVPEQPYIVRSTETETIPIIPATIDFDPNTLNLKSKGKWVTTYIELPVGHDYHVSDININSILLNDVVPAELNLIEICDYDNDGIPDLMVKFNRTEVQGILHIGDNVEIVISGKLYDCRLFEGKDIIKVIDKGKVKLKGDIKSEYLEGYYITSGYSVEWILILLLGFFGIGLIIIKERKIIF